MEVQAIKNQIKAGKFSSFYIFTGDEWKVQDIYIQQIANKSGLILTRIDSIADVYSTLKNKSFFSRAHCYVLRDDKDLLTNEKLQDQIDAGMLGQNILIFQLNSLDKRTKFYNRYKDTVVAFDPLNPAILAKYIKREINLQDRSIEKLMEICENDYGRCLLEIDKIKRFGSCTFTEVNGNGYDADAAMQYLIEDGTIYTPPKDAIFDFVDAVLDKKVNLAFDLYSQCLEIGEATLVMLSVLYTNAKAVLQVQTSAGSEDLIKTTGLTAWQIKNAKAHINKYSKEALIDMLYLIQNIESGIKRGAVEEEFAIEYVLTEVL